MSRSIFFIFFISKCANLAPHVTWTFPEVSLIDSMYPLGGLIGSLTFAFILQPIGSKSSSRIVAILQILSCALQLAASGPVLLLMARFVAGLSAAYCLMLIPIFVAEIAEPRYVKLNRTSEWIRKCNEFLLLSRSIRGFLGTFLMFTAGLGVVVAYSLGSLMRYDLCSGICMLFSIMFLILSLFLHKTPFSLLKVDRMNVSLTCKKKTQNSVSIFQ